MSIPKQENIPILLLAAGEAKRLKPLSREIIKPIVPICGTPIINIIIESYYQNGFREFIIVLGVEEENIKEAINELEIVKNGEISVEYAYQRRPMGMADAILSAEPILRKKLDEDSEYFFVSAVDVFFNEDVPKNMYEGLNKNENGNNIDILLSLVYSDDPQMAIGHGNASLDLKDEDNFKKLEKNKNKLLKIKKIIEKPGPDKRISNYYSMPIYIFRTTLFDYMKKLQKSSRGEYELQDVIENMILANKAVYGLDIMEMDGNHEPINYKNIGKYHITYMKDFLLMNFRFLGTRKNELKFTGEYPTSIEPVYSLDVVEIGDSVFIGPYVYVGKNCKINGFAEVSKSVLIGNNTIGKYAYLENCILGNGVEIPNNAEFKNKVILTKDHAKDSKDDDTSEVMFDVFDLKLD